MSGKHNPEKTDPDHLIYAGLLGFAAIAVIELVDTTAWSDELWLGFVFFALSIPLVVVGWSEAHSRRQGKAAALEWRPMVGLLGGVLVTAGFVAVLAHLSSRLAIAFLSMSAILFFLNRRR